MLNVGEFLERESKGGGEQKGGRRESEKERERERWATHICYYFLALVSGKLKKWRGRKRANDRKKAEGERCHEDSSFSDRLCVRRLAR